MRLFSAIKAYKVFKINRKLHKISPIADAFNLQAFNRNEPSKIPENITGLFKIDSLKKSSDFQLLTKNTFDKCQNLFEEAIVNNRQRKMVEILDDLSNELCILADMADCIRMLHPDSEYRQEATNSCLLISELVEKLNTDLKLYKTSVDALHKDEMDTIDRRVLELFITDFQQSGVHLENTEKFKEFVKATSESLSYAQKFFHNSHLPVSFKLSTATEQTPTLKIYNPFWDHSSTKLRRKSYEAYYKPLNEQENLISKLIDSRNRAAISAGFISFTERALKHSLGGNPKQVDVFLCKILESLKSVNTDVVSTIHSLYGKNFFSSNKDKLHPWDIPYLISLGRSFPHNKNSLINYFSLGVCMEGVANLASCLFNLIFIPEECLPGETWHSDVIKIGIFEAENLSSKRIGTVYCDFFDRPDKPGQDCHYTIRGGRVKNQGPNKGSYQSPIVCLQLNLTRNHGNIPLLNLDQVENLFHEWGHALHSMLARTRFQHVTGTRCSTDIAEIPSTLFENLALHPVVVSQYARHWETGEKLPNANDFFVTCHLLRGFGESIEVSLQTINSLFDQKLHSSKVTLNPLDYSTTSNENLTAFPSAKFLHSLQEEFLGSWYIPAINTAWTHRFGHLNGYGAKYYAYLMARAGANLIYRELDFHKDPLSSSNGRRLKEQFLSLGGEHNPKKMLTNLLGYDEHSFDIAQRLAVALVEELYEKEHCANLILNKSSK